MCKNTCNKCNNCQDSCSCKVVYKVKQPGPCDPIVVKNVTYNNGFMYVTMTNGATYSYDISQCCVNMELPQVNISLINNITLNVGRPAFDQLCFDKFTLPFNGLLYYWVVGTKTYFKLIGSLSAQTVNTVYPSTCSQTGGGCADYYLSIPTPFNSFTKGEIISDTYYAYNKNYGVGTINSLPIGFVGNNAGGSGLSVETTTSCSVVSNYIGTELLLGEVKEISSNPTSCITVNKYKDLKGLSIVPCEVNNQIVLPQLNITLEGNVG